MQKKVFPILFATLLLDMIGTGMIFPIIPILFTDPHSPGFLLHGYSQSGQYFVAGLITALFGLMQFFAAPVLGELSDVFGRKKLLSLGVAVLAAAQMLFGWGIMVASLPIIFISRAVAGVAGANFSIAQACIADITEPKDRAKNFGLMGAAFGIGFIMGPLLGGWIASTTGNPAAPFWLAGVIGVGNFVFISLMLPETRKEKSARRRFTLWKGIHNILAAFRDVDARPVYLASFLYLSGFTFFTSFIGILLVSKFAFAEGTIGTFFGIAGVWIVFTQMVILRFLTQKFSERAILRFSLVVLGSSILIYPFLPSAPWLFALVPLIAVPQGLTIATMGALVSKGVSGEKQGAALGINGSLMALSQGVIPLLAGAGSGALGIQAPFIAGAGFVGAAWLTLFKRSRRSKSLA